MTIIDVRRSPTWAAVAFALILTFSPAAEAQAQTEQGWEPLVSERQQRMYEATQYAPLVRVGDMLIGSGVIGLARGQDNSARAQFERVFERIESMLASHGLDKGDIAEITTYHVNMGELGEEFMEVKQAFFDEKPYPAWTAIGVDRLFMEQALVEVRFTAALRPE